MTPYRSISAVLVSLSLLCAAPALANEPPVAGPTDGTACRTGALSSLRTFLLEKDEAGATRAQRWATTALGVTAAGALTVGVAAVGAVAVAAPGCLVNMGECRTSIKTAFTQPPTFLAPTSSGTVTSR
jgi:hypothetical protein